MNLAGKTVLVTGVIDGESRLTAEKKLRDLGASTAKSLTGSIDLLIIGDKAGPKKLATAKTLGIEIVPWAQAINGKGASGGPPSPPAAAKARQIDPMLAQLAVGVPPGDGWLHEIKWDGVRCVATVKDGKVSMQSRSNLTDYRESYPAVAAELSTLPDCVLDGEIVALSVEGGSFQQLRDGRGVASYVVFDLLEEPHAGDVRGMTLTSRRDFLERLLEGRKLKRVTVSPTYVDGDTLYRHVAAVGMEGIVSKPRTSTYREGARGPWLKIKARLAQEFVVLGWKEGEGSRAGRIGSLLLGYYDEGWLRFCGRVGTGKTSLGGWDALRAKLTPHPFAAGEPKLDLALAKKPELRGVNWVKPEVVVQVEFQRWTEDGRLWHPSYLGIRGDKRASDVKREG